MNVRLKSRLSGRGGIGGSKAIRFKRRWRGYKSGDVITPPGGQAAQLVKSGFAEFEEQMPSKTEEVSTEPAETNSNIGKGDEKSEPVSLVGDDESLVDPDDDATKQPTKRPDIKRKK